jgi:D-3-phosphoglycerate dehydrogenase
MKGKILKLNAISEKADDIFADYEYSDGVTSPDGIMVRSAKMDEYKVNDNLLAVARAGAGTNNIPCADYAENGIVVFNTPGANANAVKELVICELFLGGRKICEAIDWVKTLKGEGDNLSKLVEKGKSKFVGCEIYGKTLAVVGLGAIGVAVANSAASLGMKICGVDPYLSTSNAVALNPSIKLYNTRDEAYKNADFITLHVPLNNETKGMIDEKTIAKMKDGVVIINNSRGELVDSKAIKSALESGKIARYITDFPTDDLIGVTNAICVPHLGASTPEAEDYCAIMAGKELVDYLQNGNIKNSVNYPAVTMPRESVARVCIHHKNIKEILAKILANISAQSINVANMQDASKGEYAYLICELDDVPTEATLDKIRALEGVIRVRLLK